MKYDDGDEEDLGAALLLQEGDAQYATYEGFDKALLLPDAAGAAPCEGAALLAATVETVRAFVAEQVRACSCLMAARTTRPPPDLALLSKLLLSILIIWSQFEDVVAAAAVVLPPRLVGVVAWKRRKGLPGGSAMPEPGSPRFDAGLHHVDFKFSDGAVVSYGCASSGCIEQGSADGGTFAMQSVSLGRGEFLQRISGRRSQPTGSGYGASGTFCLCLHVQQSDPNSSSSGAMRRHELFPTFSGDMFEISAPLGHEIVGLNAAPTAASAEQLQASAASANCLAPRLLSAATRALPSAALERAAPERALLSMARRLLEQPQPQLRSLVHGIASAWLGAAVSSRRLSLEAISLALEAAAALGDGALRARAAAAAAAVEGGSAPQLCALIEQLLKLLPVSRLITVTSSEEADGAAAQAAVTATAAAALALARRLRQQHAQHPRALELLARAATVAGDEGALREAVAEATAGRAAALPGLQRAGSGVALKACRSTESLAAAAVAQAQAAATALAPALERLRRFGEALREAGRTAEAEAVEGRVRAQLCGLLEAALTELGALDPSRSGSSARCKSNHQKIETSCASCKTGTWLAGALLAQASALLHLLSLRVLAADLALCVGESRRATWKKALRALAVTLASSAAAAAAAAAWPPPLRLTGPHWAGRASTNPALAAAVARAGDVAGPGSPLSVSSRPPARRSQPKPPPKPAAAARLPQPLPQPRTASAAAVVVAATVATTAQGADPNVNLRHGILQPPSQKTGSSAAPGAGAASNAIELLSSDDEDEGEQQEQRIRAAARAAADAAAAAAAAEGARPAKPSGLPVHKDPCAAVVNS